MVNTSDKGTTKKVHGILLKGLLGCMKGVLTMAHRMFKREPEYELAGFPSYLDARLTLQVHCLSPTDLIFLYVYLHTYVHTYVVYTHIPTYLDVYVCVY